MSDNKTVPPPQPSAQNSEELTAFVQGLLEQMQSRFSTMSEAIIGRIDEMGNRIDDLEKSIGDLMDETNDPTASTEPTKVTPGNRADDAQQASS